MQHILKVSLIFSILLFKFSALAKPTEDQIITQQVENLLVKERDIPNSVIDVSTKDGVVQISGVVDTQLQENRIIELASSVEDVVDVDNTNLTVKSSLEFVSDALVTAKAKGRIKYLSLNKHIHQDYNLHVETTNKVVHIFGNVKIPEDIKRIQTEINGIVGVKKVNMNITCE